MLVVLVGYVSAEHYHIVSNDSTSQCQEYNTGACLTLAEFASNISHFNQDNKTCLSFLPGEHLLMGRVTLSGLQNMTLTGWNSSNSLSTIKCQGTSGFEFRDIQSLNIAYLEFTGCGNVLHGGAIFISNVDNVLIRSCCFTDNLVRGHRSEGGAIYAENTVTMNIAESFFNNSSADGNLSTGGAISVNKGSISSTNNCYINNSADYGGGVNLWSGDFSSTNNRYTNNTARIGGSIYVQSGRISSTSDTYSHNSAYYGGAVQIRSGRISSTSDYYINNKADAGGGAIKVLYGNVSSTSDHHINNSAGFGGAIYGTSAHISSAGDFYINNSADYNGGAVVSCLALYLVQVLTTYTTVLAMEELYTSNLAVSLVLVNTT